MLRRSLSAFLESCAGWVDTTSIFCSRKTTLISSKLIVGSEGTLAFVTEAKLKLEPVPSSTVVSVIHFDDLIRAIEAVPVILRHQPSAVEILDHYGLELTRSNPTLAPLCAQFIHGDPQAILMVEFSGESQEEVHSAWTEMKTDLEQQKGFYACHDASSQGS